jgi:nucleoside-diphosphate-sugar epimerase
MTENPGRAVASRRVLVTGDAGSVGGALVRHLAETGARVTVLDDLFTRLPAVPTRPSCAKASSRLPRI